MTQWDSEAVLAAARAWVWIPEGAAHLQARDYVLVAYPSWFAHPTVVRPHGSGGAPERVVDEAHGIARDWGRDLVTWALMDPSPSPGLEAELLRRGAVVVERADILALAFGEGLPDLAVPDGVEVREVTDEPGLRDAYAVEADAFGTNLPDEAGLADGLAEVERARKTATGGRYVAYLDGVAAGAGGWTRAGDVARLWGAATATAWRGRGVYRAVLDARLRRAAELGCTLGLAHGRVHSSSPILRRAGFRRHGEQRMLRVGVDGATP